ncbi:2-iminoacetate synthase ThiH [Endozoicomonas sp. GU-1]|uniref:2-iminoacetate synthase ThiH n=1 Tax=Endozoicomonas sp. GU-1 TaxID=3009078 RepID=UPI0022B55789|nr:2-iminoacetate synthase ThiH [Endozoicomonas sp. GU-1]WBA80330.1 2-iminoacetate synthase ThiH [Endozoicomonas sp. GU-1]WBA87899.1 2-iminoacetate synthase ThiH [Endozoicomonas sp. GU-1]
MTFLDHFNQLQWDELKMTIHSQTAADVENALHSTRLNHQQFLALISPAAEPYLEAMAQKSRQLTRQRFGNTLQLFIPLYLSNKCTNICTYCGFSLGNKIRRKTLKMDELDREVAAIKKMGFDHILLVTGEAPGTVGVSYIKSVIERLRPHFAHISIEVQPLDQEDYQSLMAAGLDAVLVYQETYHRSAYEQYHLRGSKMNFNYRLETADRLGRAGIDKIGVGALIGLEDWRTDSAMVAAHLDYLEKTYWRTRYAISFPRLRPCEGDFQPVSVISDRQLVQLICAYRLFKPEAELSLSTRESATFRDNVLPLGITTMSAYSSTHPGGYADDNILGNEDLEQFTIDDNRRPEAVADAIRAKGLEPVWKDWGHCFRH